MELSVVNSDSSVLVVKLLNVSVASCWAGLATFVRFVAIKIAAQSILPTLSRVTMPAGSASFLDSK